MSQCVQLVGVQKTELLPNLRSFLHNLKSINQIGQKLNADAIKKLLTNTGIPSPDWEEIGNQLGLQLEGHISAADFFDEWRAHDPKISWMKLAKALEKIPCYQHASSNVCEKQGMFGKPLLKHQILSCLLY